MFILCTSSDRSIPGLGTLVAEESLDRSVSSKDPHANCKELIHCGTYAQGQEPVGVRLGRDRGHKLLLTENLHQTRL